MCIVPRIVYLDDHPLALLLVVSPLRRDSRTFELVPVYLSGSFPTFIQYLQNRFFKSLAIITILRTF